jgi:C4-type Zn-finger protein
MGDYACFKAKPPDVPVADCVNSGFPVCAQCRNTMKLMVCVPDFANSLLATYQCRDCGLLDRLQIGDGEPEAILQGP